MRSIAAELNVTRKWNAIIAHAAATTQSSDSFLLHFLYVADSFPAYFQSYDVVDTVNFVAESGDEIDRMSDKFGRTVDFVVSMYASLQVYLTVGLYIMSLSARGSQSAGVKPMCPYKFDA